MLKLSFSHKSFRCDKLLFFWKKGRSQHFSVEASLIVRYWHFGSQVTLSCCPLLLSDIALKHLLLLLLVPVVLLNPAVSIESKHEVTILSGLNEFVVKFHGPAGCKSLFQCLLCSASCALYWFWFKLDLKHFNQLIFYCDLQLLMKVVSGKCEWTYLTNTPSNRHQ